ncbi:hypothetical protein BT69DRAFT_1286083 [Atractiella rhizophila]|nr:hypothetical protein BT69DRAFT_1286083 [Atractiella rhizophila]
MVQKTYLFWLCLPNRVQSESVTSTNQPQRKLKAPFYKAASTGTHESSRTSPRTWCAIWGTESREGGSDQSWGESGMNGQQY